MYAKEHSIDIANILKLYRGHIIQNWSDRLHREVSPLYSEQPIEEILCTVSEATDANYDVIVNNDFSGINAFVEKIEKKRSGAGFPLEDVLRAFELYRYIVTPLLIHKLEPSVIIEAIERLNLCLSTTIYKFSNYYKTLHEKEVANYIQNLESDVEKRTKDLSESESNFRALTENSTAAIFVIQGEKYTYINPAFTAITGYTFEELSTMSFWDFIHPDIRDMVRTRGMARQRNEDMPPRYELKFIRKSGTEGFGDFGATFIEFQGKPALLGSVFDITERKLIEEEKRSSEEKYRIIFENSVEGIFQTTPEGRILNANPAMAKMHGFDSSEEMIAYVQDMSELYVNNEDRLKFKTLVELQGLVTNFEVQQYRKDGSILWVRLNARAVRNAEAKILYYEGAVEEITERKQMQEALRESEERFRMLFEHAGDAIAIIKDNILVDCNEKYLAMFGYKRDQILGQLPYIFAPEFQPDGSNSKKEAMDMMHAARLGTPQFFEYQFKCADGTLFDAEVSLSSFVIHEETYLQTIFRDITDRKRLNEELRRLSIAIEQAAEDVVITDPEGIIQYVNPAFEKITGYSRSEAIGRNPRFLKSGIHDALFYKGMWKTIKSGIVWTGRFTNKRKDGALVQEEATISPLVNSDRRLMGYVALKRDITEEVRLESQLRQAQKMEAIGTLAGGVAHDFNNILTVITGYATLLQMSMEETNPLRVYIDPILSSSQNAANLTRSLLAFSRKQPINLTPFDINKDIKDTEKLLKRLLTEDIELATFLAPQDIIIMADATQIDQILFNLATNARDAMKKGGSLTIETRIIEIDNNFKQAYGFGTPGRYALLSIADTGIGMDEATKEKIFEPFFTTKEVGKGTGLGLSTVYGIVKQHNGYINVYSKSGYGTTFHIYLPLAEDIFYSKEISFPQITGGRETILVAEDSEGVRLLLKEVLTKHGYVVLESVDGNDAINSIKQHPDLDLIILDSVMPKKNGREVYDEAHTAIPDIKVLFMSGYTSDIVLDKGIEEKDFDFISKPILPDELLRKVRKILDS